MNSDVIIAGGGPTGLWMACELALAGVRVVVLEKLAKATGLSKALGLQARSMEMLAYRGILDRFAAGNPTVPFLNFGMFPLDLRKLEFPHPYGLVIPQARVEALLEERAKELGAEIRRGHELIGVSQDEDGITVSVRTDSRDCEMKAQYLAGCDGGHSVVRKEMGVAFPGVEPTVVGYMGDVKLDPSALHLLRQNGPELVGGRDFGVARTKTGNFAIVPLGANIYRIAAVEWDRDAANHETEMTLGHLRAAITRVTGIDLPIQEAVWLTRPTDSSRLADRYRIGRVFLAGDAAHVHWGYGGKGLQTGIQDAGNLGWKLAAQVRGSAPPSLLDTYHSERHPIGQRLLTLSRALEALARPGEHVSALRELFARLLAQEVVLRTIVEELSDVDIRYDMHTAADDHPLLGKWAPNLTLHSNHRTNTVAELMKGGKGVFIDLDEKSPLSEVALTWGDRVDVTSARCYERPAHLEAMLVRPDGYVAWVRKSEEDNRDAEKTLRVALETWFGLPS